VRYLILLLPLLSGCVLIWDSTSGKMHQYTTVQPVPIYVEHHEPDYSADMDAGIYRGEERL
jgi:hypothetical protein